MIHKNSRTWYGKYLIHDTKSNLTMNYEIDMSFNSSIEKECRNFCGFGNDCIKEHYTPECTLESGDDNSFYITVAYPRNPLITVEHSPKIQLEEFMCYITIIINLWLGFSVIMLSNFCLSALKKISLTVGKFKQAVNKTYTTNVIVLNRIPINNTILVSQRRHNILERSSNA
jgi:hypothetical protein